MSELLRALGALAEAPGPEQARIASAMGLPGQPATAEYAELFLFQLYPYGSVYLGAGGMLGGDARDRVAGFWSAIGELPPEEPDHLTVLLAQLAAIAEREGFIEDAPGKRILRHARHAFFWEHVGSWLFAYLGRAREIAAPFYRAWAETLTAALLDEAELLGPARELPLHFRDVPAMPAPSGADADRIADALLAPVRSGIILTRTDLARIGADMGVAARLGERRQALARMLASSPGRAFGLLADEASRQAALHRAGPSVLARIADFWASRAEATAEALAARV
ncbi:MAG: molecular chaperone TorD family protein [Longimicrobiales bacterium]